MTLMEQKFYTVREVADTLKMHYETVRTMLSDEPGVLRYHGDSRKRRGYATIRVPAAVVESVLRRYVVS